MPPNGAPNHNPDHGYTPPSRRRQHSRSDSNGGRMFNGHPFGMMPSSMSPLYCAYPCRYGPFSPASRNNESTSGNNPDHAHGADRTDSERQRDSLDNLESYRQPWRPDRQPSLNPYSSSRTNRTSTAEGDNEQPARIARRQGDSLPPALERMLQRLETNDRSNATETSNRSHSRESTVAHANEDEEENGNNENDQGSSSPRPYVEDPDDIDSLDNHIRMLRATGAFLEQHYDEGDNGWEHYDPATFGQPEALAGPPLIVQRGSRRPAFRTMAGRRRFPGLHVDTSAGRTMGSDYLSAGTPSGIGPDVSGATNTGNVSTGNTTQRPRVLSRRAQRFLDDHTKVITTSDSEAPNTECPICFDTVEEHDGTCVHIKNVPGCQHMIGLECIKAMLTHGHEDNKVVCPYCRTTWLQEVGSWEDAALDESPGFLSPGFLGVFDAPVWGPPVFGSPQTYERVQSQRERDLPGRGNRAISDAERGGREFGFRYRSADNPLRELFPPNAAPVRRPPPSSPPQ